MNNNNIYICQFDGCKYTSPIKTNYSRHIKIHDRLPIEKIEYNCNKCSYKTFRKASFTIHNNNNCFIQKLLQCDFNDCVYSTINKTHLKIHKKTHETEYLCDKCDFKTYHLIDFNKHLKEHREYFCDYLNCNYNTKILKDYNQHLKSHSDNYFICAENNCGFKYSNIEDLDKHMHMHLCKNLNNEYYCNYKNCTYNTLNKHDFKYHLKYHYDLKYICSIENCNAKFAIKSDLDKH
jgi:hypothetical protein